MGLAIALEHFFPFLFQVTYDGRCGLKEFHFQLLSARASIRFATPVTFKLSGPQGLFQ